MKTASCFAFLIAALIAGSPSSTLAQSVQSKVEARGSISGSVTNSGQPAVGIKVVALAGPDFQPNVLAAGLTDSSGRYRLADLPAGDCRVTVDAPSYAAAGERRDRAFSQPEKAVKLKEGETLEGLDLEITPGGVITGRVVDEAGRPVIGKTVEIVPIDEKGDDYYVSFTFGDKLRPSSDDRGIYRAFGHPPGRYKLRVGSGASHHSVKSNFGQVPIPEAYYSGASSVSKGGIVDVAAGSETTGIDITINRSPATRKPTYTITGKVLDAGTGAALSGVRVSCTRQRSRELAEARELDDYVDENGTSNSKGEFRVEGLLPGTYTLEVSPSSDSPWYSDEQKVQISAGDIDGVDVRVKRAGTISGIVALEGTGDPEASLKLAQIKISERLIGFWGGAQINQDRTFRLTGVSSGSHMLSIDANSLEAGFEVLRLERGGVEQPNRRIDVGPGEDVTGVKVILGYYKGSIRGEITIVGALPKGAYMVISATPTNQPKKDRSYYGSSRLVLSLSRWRHGSIDSRGHYLIDRLPPGEYEVNLDAYLRPSEDDPKRDSLPVTVAKVISVTGDTPVELPMVLELSNLPEVKKQ